MSAAAHLYPFLFVFCGCGTRTHSTPQNLSPRSVPQIVAEPSAQFDELSRRAGQIAGEIAKLRGWDPHLAVKLEMAGNDRIIAAMLADERSQTSPAVQHAEAEFLSAFGWVPVNFDFERDVTKYFSQDLLGLYCFSWRRILLTEGRDRAAIESTLRHELVHAFQDEHFRIGDRVRWHSDQGDRIAAVHSLAEGEAICLSRQLEDPQRRDCTNVIIDDFEHPLHGLNLDAVPAVIRYALMSPYVDGVRYVQQLLRRGGWHAVELAWLGKLRATRDLLHPDEASVEPTVAVEIPAPMTDFGSCRAEYVDVLGAQGLASVLFGRMSPDAVKLAVSSLAADRAVVWRCVNACASAWHVRLARPGFARPIANAIWASIGEAPAASTTTRSCKQTDQGAASLVVLGRDIAITSVHGCHGVVSQPSAVSCQISLSWADRLIAH